MITCYLGSLYALSFCTFTLNYYVICITVKYVIFRKSSFPMITCICLLYCQYAVRGITLLCDFRTNDLINACQLFDQFDILVIISCYIYPILYKTLSSPLSFQKITVYELLWSDIGFPLHFISVAHCCHLMLIENVTQM